MEIIDTTLREKLEGDSESGKQHETDTTCTGRKRKIQWELHREQERKKHESKRESEQRARKTKEEKRGQTSEGEEPHPPRQLRMLLEHLVLLSPLLQEHSSTNCSSNSPRNRIGVHRFRL